MSLTHMYYFSYLCNTDWRTADDPTKAIKHFFEGLKEGGKNLPPLQLCLNAGDDEEEWDSNLISFYKQKQAKTQWAAPFNCRILGIRLHTKTLLSVQIRNNQSKQVTEEASP